MANLLKIIPCAHGKHWLVDYWFENGDDTFADGGVLWMPEHFCLFGPALYQDNFLKYNLNWGIVLHYYIFIIFVNSYNTFFTAFIFIPFPLFFFLFIFSFLSTQQFQLKNSWLILDKYLVDKFDNSLIKSNVRKTIHVKICT